MNIAWKKIKEEGYKSGYRKMIRRTFELPNGIIADYDIVDAGQAVCVLAMTADNKFVMNKIFRAGPEKVLMELPGGFLDPGLTPEQAIKQELLEETGYTGKFKLVGTSYDDAYNTLFRYHFVATECKKVQEPHKEPDEIGSETVLLSLDGFKKNLKSGELTDPETAYMGLLGLDLI